MSEALKEKVARERVGIEVAGCFAGPNPLLAAELFHKLQVFPAVFQVPDTVKDQLSPDYGAACVRSIRLAQPLLTAHAALVRCMAALASERIVHDFGYHPAAP